MPDSVTSAGRSRIMASIRSTGTAPEKRLFEVVRSLLTGSWQIDSHVDLPGRPDLFIRRLGFAIFCDGCFFHGCPDHGKVPETNRSYWEPKLLRNMARDKSVSRRLRRMGYSVVRVWEHDLTLEALPRTRARLSRHISKLRTSPPRASTTQPGAATATSPATAE